MRSKCRLVALAAVAALGGTPASPDRAVASRAAGPAASALEVRAAGSGYRVEAPSYRAALDPDGVRFMPRSGAMPGFWSYRLVAIEHGRRLPVTLVPPVLRGPGVVEYHRPGLIERYEIGREGIEQVFVVQERSSAPRREDDDLVLVGRVDAIAEPTSDNGAVHYGGGPFGVSYGAPAAFDARGRPVAVRTRIVPGGLELRLDGRDLASATLPVTVDPVIQPGQKISGGAFVAGEPDVAYDPLRGEFLAVWATSGGAIQGRSFDATGGTANQVWILAEASAEHPHDEPAIAFNPTVAEYYVTWRRLVTTGVYFIEGRRVGSGVSSAGGIEQITTSLPVGAMDDRPDVASCGQATQPFLVAWQRHAFGAGTYRVWARYRGAGAVSGAREVSVADSSYEPAPRLAFDPFAGRYLVVWAAGVTIKARSMIGDDIGPEREIVPVNRMRTHSRPSVAFDIGSRRYLVAWHEATLVGRDVVRGIASVRMTSATNPAPFPRQVLREDDADVTITGPPEVLAEHGGFVVAYETRRREDGALDLEATHYGDERGAVRTSLGAFAHIASGDAPGRRIGLCGPNQYGWLMGVWPQTEDGNRVAHGAILFSQFAYFVHSSTMPTGGRYHDRQKLFRPTTGMWLTEGTADGGIVFGGPGDVPVLLDADGDNVDELAVWSPARGLWSMRNGRTGAVTSVVIGRGGDIPVPGDYDGDRRDDIAVWRPGSGTWFIRESSHGGALRIVQWGALGDLPVPADFSGDLVTDFAVWHAATGSWQILTNVPGDEYSGPVREVFWGDAGDVPINGNFIGDDLADFVVWSPVWGWRILENHQLSQEQVRIGERGDVPMPVERGVDGDLDPAVFRPRDGFWQVSDSATGALSLFPFGATGDIPVGRRR